MLEPLDGFVQEHDVTIYYYNPNIHPMEEYERRRDVLVDHLETAGVQVLEGEYSPAEWVRAVAVSDLAQGVRCRECFRLRLGETARRAAESGFDAFATTLTVSPYQDQDAIREAGEEAAGRFGVRYVHADFRARYRDSVERSRSLGMYRQKYCGCILSEVEAAQARAAKRKGRRR
ncbi:MAG: epoxyqueuosine reductase QueH [Coriobacteriia bacterium]